MAASWIQFATGSASATTTPATFTTANITAGNTIFVSIACGNNNTPTSITDSAGNTYTQAVWDGDATNGWACGVYYAPITVGGGTKPTVTVHWSGSVSAKTWIDEVSGLNNSAIIDVAGVHAAAGATGLTVSSTAMATNTDPNGFIIGVSLSNSTVTAGETNWTNNIQSNNWQREYWANPGATAAYAATWTQTTSSKYVAAVASFKTTSPPPLVSIAVNNANLYWSPYNWRTNGSTWTQTCPGGGYLKVAFTGTTLGIHVDKSTMGGVTLSSMMVNCYIDGATTPTVSTNIGAADANSLITFTTSLTAGNHYAIIYLSQSPHLSDRWTTPAEVLRITDIALANGASVLTLTGTAIQPATKKILMYGDSITEGYMTTKDEVGYAPKMAKAMSVEYGQVGFAGTAWAVPLGTPTNVPALFDGPPDDTLSSWQNFDSAKSRLVNNANLSAGFLDGAPDAIFVNMGTNDAIKTATTATMRARVTAWITAVRTVSPNTSIFVISPFNYGSSSTPYTTYKPVLTGGFTDYTSANPTDLQVFMLDLGSSGYTTVTSNSTDNIHPNDTGSASLATSLAGLVKTVPNVVGSTTSAASTSITGAGLTVGTTTNVYSSTVANGNVISHKPPAGVYAASSAPVNLTVSLGAQIAPTGIASAQAFGAPAVTQPGVIAAQGIPSAQAFGVPAIARFITMTGIASAQAFGTLTTTRFALPTGIASVQAFGLPSIARFINPTGIVSAEAFGTLATARFALPTGIISAQAFGTLTTTRFASPAGIVSAQAFGVPVVALGNRNILPVGIPSAQAFGTARVIYPQFINATGIVSASAFGILVVSVPPPPPNTPPAFSYSMMSNADLYQSKWRNISGQIIEVDQTLGFTHQWDQLLPGYYITDYTYNNAGYLLSKAIARGALAQRQYIPVLGNLYLQSPGGHWFQINAVSGTITTTQVSVSPPSQYTQTQSMVMSSTVRIQQDPQYAIAVEVVNGALVYTSIAFDSNARGVKKAFIPVHPTPLYVPYSAHIIFQTGTRTYAFYPNDAGVLQLV